MTLLYRIHDEIAIELEVPTWNTVVRLLEDELKVRAIMAVTGATTIQLNGLANAIRAHLQHIEPADPCSDGPCSHCRVYGHVHESWCPRIVPANNSDLF